VEPLHILYNRVLTSQGFTADAGMHLPETHLPLFARLLWSEQFWLDDTIEKKHVNKMPKTTFILTLDIQWQ